MRLIVTRPQPDAQRTAAALARQGHQVAVAALLRIETVADAALGTGPWSALAVTSVNALRAIETHARRAELLGLCVFAVGRGTAAAARDAGFADVITAGGNVQELVQCLRARSRAERGGHPLLYLAGEDRSGDLAGDLATDGQIVSTVVVYRAVKLAEFPPAVATALAAGEIDGVLHFSRRSAEAYLDCACAGAIVPPALAPAHYCLSRKVAEPLIAAGAARIHVAARPDEAALLAAIDAV